MSEMLGHTHRTSTPYCIAIIGAGPTGLSALENLFLELNHHGDRQTIKVLLFDNTNYFGSGWVYDLNQPSTNWLNIPYRKLAIKGRRQISYSGISIPPFPSFHLWSKNQDYSNMLDLYPTRSWLGKYLNERYFSIADTLQKNGILMAMNQKVKKIQRNGPWFDLKVKDGAVYPAHEVVLTVGHQATRLSKQLIYWQERCKKCPNLSLFTEPYPVDRFRPKNTSFKGKTVALRGFGLAMLDVTRALSEGLGGRFEVVDKPTQSMKFTTSEFVPEKILPFTLDGLPLVPKPLNQIVDQKYKPNAQEMRSLRQNLLINVAQAKCPMNHYFVIEVMAKVAAGIFIRFKEPFGDHSLTRDEAQSLAVKWLNDESTTHNTIVPRDLATAESMKVFVRMATGSGPVSLDYCIGQVWRHSQQLLYKHLSFTNLPIEIVKSIVDLDERMKRYSYGPPVASIQQLHALIDAKILSLCMVDDPDIELSYEGWHFEIDGKSLIATTMINTVLDPPQLLKVKSELIQNLIMDNLITPIHQEMGALTQANGLVINPGSKYLTNLAILGRLANGSVVGIDSLKECFGTRTKDWAKSVVKRLPSTMIPMTSNINST